MFTLWMYQWQNYFLFKDLLGSLKVREGGCFELDSDLWNHYVHNLDNAMTQHKLT